MKILCVDTYGESALDWLLRCKADGHTCRWFISERKTPIGQGMGIEIVPDWHVHMTWADLVFLPDNLKYLKELDAWRERGVKIIGPSAEAAAWETDRKLGMDVLEDHGIECPAYREFSSYDPAIAYVKKEDRPFVVKPCGNETDKALSYVAPSPEALVYKLEQWKKQQKLKGTFILQEKVSGCEMGVGGWFGPGGFNEGWEENFEHKKLMPGDLGQNTGEMGTVMRFTKRSKLARLMLSPFEETLERMNYVGCIDINCIIDEAGKPWPLEFTMRPGWPAFNIQQSLHRGDSAEWLLDLVEGRECRCFDLDKVAVGVVMALPPFPNPGEKREEVVGVPLYGLKPSIMDAIHPCQVMMGSAPQAESGKIRNGPMWVSAGSYVLVATGTGATVREARQKVYRVLDNLRATPHDPFWRTDIGAKMRSVLPECQKHGFAAGMGY